MDLIPRKYLLDDFFNDFVTSKGNGMMKCDIYEENDAYNIELDIPGFDKKDINIECKDGCLTITANKENINNIEEKNYIIKERSFGKYSRSFNLGDINPDEIAAKFNNGTLFITIPKEEKQENKKVIEIGE